MKSKKQLEDELEGLKNSRQTAVEEAESQNEEFIRKLAIERQTIDHLKVLSCSCSSLHFIFEVVVL